MHHHVNRDRPKKVQRISQACDFCHRRSIRCRPSVERPAECQNCCDFAVDCTYNRPSRRRRDQREMLPVRRSVLPSAPASAHPSQSQQQQLPGAHEQSRNDNTRRLLVAQDVSPYVLSAPSQIDETSIFALTCNEQPGVLSTAWRAFALTSLHTIEHYLGIYEDLIYPLYPLFHPPTLWEKIRNREHVKDEGLFASIMAACALAAARVRDGAGGERADIDTISLTSSELFFIAAQDMVFRELHRARGMDYLRACGLLALTAIQYEDDERMHLFMGHYHTLCAKIRFHDEMHWPANISVIEKEERRRLIWSMYCLEVYRTIVFDSVMQTQEISFNVRYPTEVDDDQLFCSVTMGGDCVSWMRGWNFAVDLSRVLEHAINRLRRHKQALAKHTTVVQLIAATGSTERQVLENVTSIYAQLPDRFKDYLNIPTGDRRQDIYIFQAANIQAMLQLVRMALFAAESPPNLDQQCTVMDEVLSSFHSMSLQLLRDMSAPLVHLLVCMMRLLIPAPGGGLTEPFYRRMRGLLTSTADLLAAMASGYHSSAGASQWLRMQIATIDQYMEAQRRTMPGTSASGSSQALSSRGTGGVTPSHERVSDNLDLADSIGDFSLSADIVPDSAWS